MNVIIFVIFCVIMVCTILLVEYTNYKDAQQKKKKNKEYVIYSDSWGRKNVEYVIINNEKIFVGDKVWREEIGNMRVFILQDCGNTIKMILKLEDDATPTSIGKKFLHPLCTHINQDNLPGLYHEIRVPYTDKKLENLVIGRFYKIKEEKNMREIKAGDKVKVISITHEDTDCCPIVGNIYTVIEIRKCPFSGSDYAVFKETDFKGLPLTCYLFNCELVNKKEKEIFTKEQLKDGDIVILRNGWDTVVDIKNRVLLYKDNALMISGYNENLTSKFGHNWDIMKVKRQTLLYNREKQTEMTLEEVCKELGRDIKIVKEH